jgi:hypothetical protein
LKRQKLVGPLFLLVIAALASAVLIRFKSRAPELPTIPRYRQATPAEVRASTAVITQQLLDFKAGNFDAAQLLQARNDNAGFSSAEQARKVVSTFYPQFLKFSRVRFGRCLVDQTGTRTQIDIILVDSYGAATGAQYVVVKERGEWRIYSVLSAVEGYYAGVQHRPAAMSSHRSVHQQLRPKTAAAQPH